MGAPSCRYQFWGPGCININSINIVYYSLHSTVNIHLIEIETWQFKTNKKYNYSWFNITISWFNMVENLSFPHTPRVKGIIPSPWEACECLAAVCSKKMPASKKVGGSQGAWFSSGTHRKIMEHPHSCPRKCLIKLVVDTRMIGGKTCKNRQNFLLNCPSNSVRRVQ